MYHAREAVNKQLADLPGKARLIVTTKVDCSMIYGSKVRLWTKNFLLSPSVDPHNVDLADLPDLWALMAREG
jgi:hypothetical protein